MQNFTAVHKKVATVVIETFDRLELFNVGQQVEKIETTEPSLNS